MKAIVNKYHKLRTLFTMGISGDEYKYVLDSESDADTPIDELARIYANAAVLNDTFNNIDSSDYDACQNLLHDCLAHREQTLAWYGSRLGVKAGPFECEKGDILCTGLPSTDELFGPPYRFLSLDIARAHFVFWSAMLTIQPFIYHVKAMIRAQTDMGSPIEPSQDDDYLIAGWFADQVVRTMPFCVQDKYKLSGAHILIFLTGQIAKIYNDLGYARKMAWCLEAYGLLANLGFNAGNHLKELVWEQWGNAHKSDLNTSVKEESRRSVRGHGVPALQIAQCSLDLQSLKTLAIPDIIFLPAPEPTSLDIPEITGPCQ
ncbi:hypothetical protein N7462_007749 [Penicillium macrosclerotiorum]|uniref:uncharacterized protein n=1 Tax=Penicillium macrosclerotiorum TaxID=303699 RepID=UPI00254900A9|nr:uncharacterized protein N7462_007749 [Penicillium macrosclerotiorum]KAJ5679505.1 hypothetical protein N7462_007749 [Penicillium macrosclerotiorum]